MLSVVINVQDSGLLLQADPTKVLVLPFDLSWDKPNDGPSRANRLIDQILTMPAADVRRELKVVRADFADRHDQMQQIFMSRYEEIARRADIETDSVDRDRAELLGAYFCQEYSYASAALMNPSVTLHYDQSGLANDEQRIVVSTRAVGEGHISSIAFREGVVSACGAVTLDPDPQLSTVARVTSTSNAAFGETVTLKRNEDTSLSEMVLFPVTEAQRGGLEDLRLTRMPSEANDSSYEWIGTYTAYSGHEIRSEVLRTDDFKTFQMVPMRGDAARNKGMALFPKRINGNYAMIGRQDGENLFYIESENLLEWSSGQQILAPKYSWEFVQIGNCGPPIELDQGWLLLTHGVGAMRKYAIGAALLDKENPSKVLARTSRPILSAAKEHRDGYVPNVVYTCGAIVCETKLFLPYAIADSSIAFAFVDLMEILDSMVPCET